MPPRVPLETRENVVKMWMRGVPQRKIATAAGTTQKTVNRIISAFRDEKRIGDAARNTSRKTTEDEDSAMVAAAREDPFITAGQIRDTVGVDVSDELVRQRLRGAGLRSRNAAQKPLLSAHSKEKRLAFAQAHVHWTTEDWQDVAFTDESRVCTEWSLRRRVYRPDNKRYDPQYVQHVRSSGRKCVNVSGLITKDGLGPIHRIEDRFCSEKYLDIIDQELLPHLLDGPFQDGCFLLRHDLSPIHTASKVKAHLEGIGIMTLDWPPQGADINIIENVWGILKTNLAKMELHYATCDELWEHIQAEWETIKKISHLAAALCESLPRRVAQVVESGSEFINYGILRTVHYT